MYTPQKKIYMSFVYIMYPNASNITPFYTHISLYVIWRVHHQALKYVA